MLQTFVSLHLFFALVLGAILGAWAWSMFGVDTHSSKAHLDYERDLKRTQRLRAAAEALAQRLLYVCAEHNVNPFPQRDSRMTGLVRGIGYVYVAPASFRIPKSSDWEERTQEADDVAVFQFATGGRLRLVSVNDRKMESHAMEFHLNPPPDSATSASAGRLA